MDVIHGFLQLGCVLQPSFFQEAQALDTTFSEEGLFRFQGLLQDASHLFRKVWTDTGNRFCSSNTAMRVSILDRFQEIIELRHGGKALCAQRLDRPIANARILVLEHWNHLRCVLSHGRRARKVFCARQVDASPIPDSRVLILESRQVVRDVLQGLGLTKLHQCSCCRPTLEVVLVLQHVLGHRSCCQMPSIVGFAIVLHSLRHDEAFSMPT
mmetsp:Transcript_63515/g.112998  ORF Transcript_63515/g.112998 Transcript_63515/m.112998 type:complete len:212 (+) Transcript_63515:845-1480(+)